MPFLQPSLIGSNGPAGQLGGWPRVPLSFVPPLRADRSGQMDLFVQVDSPQGHRLHTYTAAFFFDISQVDETNLIPMHSTPDRYPDRFDDAHIERMQKYFRCFLFERKECHLLESSLSGVAHRGLDFVETKREGTIGWAGDTPRWTLDNETPPLWVDNTSPIFGFQITENTQFTARPESRPQLQVSYFTDSEFEERNDGRYEVFVANEIFFFFYPVDGDFKCVVNVQGS